MEKAGKVDYATVKSSFQSALTDDPRLVEAYHNLGVIAEAEGKPDEALDLYKKALAQNPKFAPAIENMAGVLVSQQKSDEAQKALEQFVATEPSAPRPRVALAAIYHDRKNFTAALDQCRAALQREPKNLPAFEQMTTTYAALGNVPMARLVAARGLKVDAKDAVIHHQLGRLLLAENKIPEAVLEFKQALERDPACGQARIDLAEVALQYRDFGNAKLHYSELIKDQPNDVPSLLALGIACKGLGQGDEAKAAYEKALAIDPKNASAKIDLAILFHRSLNDFANALKYYQAYLEAPLADGPKVEEIKASITELEQTIAALKEAEKLEQMEKERAATQPAAAPEQPASQPADVPPAAPPAGGGT